MINTSICLLFLPYIIQPTTYPRYTHIATPSFLEVSLNTRQLHLSLAQHKSLIIILSPVSQQILWVRLSLIWNFATSTATTWPR